MNYNFFADREDKIKVLEFIFKETDLEVFDSYSAYEQNICEYKDVQEITLKFDLINGGGFATTFQLWSPRHKGNVLFNKIDLNPKYTDGHTFRYSANGWGLIQLYFGGLKNNQLAQSHIGHFTEKRALTEKTSAINGNADNWDWVEIQKSSRQLKNYIHNKLAVKKIGSLGVLSGAAKLESDGVKLI